MNGGNFRIDQFEAIVGDNYELEELTDKSGSTSIGQRFEGFELENDTGKKITKELTRLQGLINKSDTTILPDFTELFKLINKNEPEDNTTKAKVIKALKEFLQSTVDIKSLNTSINIFYIVQAIAILEGQDTIEEMIDIFESLQLYIRNTIASAPFTKIPEPEITIAFAKKVLRRINAGNTYYEVPPPSQLIDSIGEKVRNQLRTKFEYIDNCGISSAIGGESMSALGRTNNLSQSETKIKEDMDKHNSSCQKLCEIFFKKQPEFNDVTGGTLTAKEFCEFVVATFNGSLYAFTPFSANNPNFYEGNERYEILKLKLEKDFKTVGEAFNLDRTEMLQYYPKPLLTALPYQIVERVSDLIAAEQERLDAEALKNLRSKSRA